MHILFAPAHYFISDRSGSEASWPVYALRALAKLGHTVSAVAGVADLTEPLPANIQLKVLFGSQRADSALAEYRRKLAFYPKVACWTTDHLKTGTVDVVHHFAPISPQSPNLPAATGRLGRIPFTMGPAMAPARAGEDLDVAMGVKKDWQLQLTKLGIGLVTAPAYRLYRRTLARADHLFAVTTEAADYFRALLPPAKTSVVPAGIEVARFTPGGAPRHNPYIILALCYLIKRKGLDVLIEAFAEVAARQPQARLWIVGRGPEEAHLKVLAQERGVAKRVRFWGFVDNRQVKKYYAEAGVFVSPTRFEPFGQTFLEAMAAGLPVVASKVGGIPDIVTPAVGRLHPVDDAAALAEILVDLLAHPAQLRTMGRAATKRVERHYDWSVIMRQYLDVWERLVKERS